MNNYFKPGEVVYTTTDCCLFYGAKSTFIKAGTILIFLAEVNNQYCTLYTEKYGISQTNHIWLEKL